MMSAICHNFIQNAWKKELCSNCFKSKEEHHQLSLAGINNRHPSSTLVARLNETNAYLPQSIMKTAQTVQKSKRSVCFPKDESKIIGYGGEDWTENEEFELSDESSGDEVDLAPDDDDEKERQRITKSNTDFNTVTANLNGETCTETRRTYAQLMLGKPQTNAEGKKQTLLVSVTPFGHETNNRKVSSAKVPEVKLSHVPIAKNKDSIPETKPTVILTAFTKNEDAPKSDEKSLLDEITETLEKNKTLIQMKNTKNEVQTEYKSKANDAEKNKENVPVVSENNNHEFIKTKAECIYIKDETGSLKNLETRKNGLTRHTVIKRDQEKPTIYQGLNINSKCKLPNERISSNNRDTNKLEISKKDIVQDLSIVEATSPVLVKSEIKYINNEVLTISPQSNVDQKPLQQQQKFVSEIDAQISLVDFQKTDATTPPMEFTESTFDVEVSRESAGEPDGRADPDISEPPALPLTPPPITDPQPTFLQTATKKSIDKPKVPVKPNKVLQQMHGVKRSYDLPPLATNTHPDDVITDVECSSDETYSYDNLPLQNALTQQDSNGSDINKNHSKRRAPKPPTPTPDEVSSLVFARNDSNATKLDAPAMREKEKRERASSCSPKFRTCSVSSNPTGESTPNLHVIPEPAPRRSLSLSQDNLMPILGEKTEEKKKNRGRFSLKKFLRIGSSKDVDKIHAVVTPNKTKIDSLKMPIPQPKPRLVIVHPSELNGSGVEVLKSEMVSTRMSGVPDDCSISISTSSVCSSSERDTPTPPRPSKPPPPPRNADECKPLRPPPPNHEDILRHQKIWSNNYVNTPSSSSTKDNIYANVGEVRAAITPSKPVRTASMREREAAMEAQKQKRRNVSAHMPAEHNYESVELRNKDAENVYDFVNGLRSSSPECDATVDKESAQVHSKNIRCRSAVISQRPSDGSIDSSPEYRDKFHAGFMRATSLPYCGSETESEIYSPYSFYGSEADVGDEESEWSNSSTRTCKLRSRKGRSIVHKNLEDNYGAVVVANHEALAQVLEHMHQTPIIQPALRGLKTAPNLRWVDFSVVEGITSIRVGRKCFHTALWGAHHVTLALTQDQGSMLQTNTVSLAPITLIPITEFSDLVPSMYLPIAGHNSGETRLVQATVAVLPWMKVDTIQSLGAAFRTKTPVLAQQSTGNAGHSTTDEILCREACFVLLQLVNGLKCIQAQGIEELPLSLNNFALCRDLERDTHPRLCLLQGFADEISRLNSSEPDDQMGSLCECALAALHKLLPISNLNLLLEDLLRRERAISLTQVKSVLEFSLWGPSDVAYATPIKDRELALQRWLDLERATVLHGLVRTRVQLTVFEECHLLFLVRSSAKMMCEASVLLDRLAKPIIPC